MAKILNILETAYRGTLEEQDDTVLWITQAVKGAGGDVSLLLRGNGVNYAVKGQDASGLSFGDLKLPHPPELDKDITKMIEKGIQVYLVKEDAEERGLSSGDLVGGIKQVSKSELPALVDQHDRIWHW